MHVAIAFQFQHEIKIIRGYTCIAWHCQCVPTFAHQLHDLSKCSTSNSSCNLYSRVTRCQTWAIYQASSTTLRKYLAQVFEFPLKSSDLYRISPTTLVSFEWWNSSAQLAIFDRLSIKFLWTKMLEIYTKMSLDVSATDGINMSQWLQWQAADI